MSLLFRVARDQNGPGIACLQAEEASGESRAIRLPVFSRLSFDGIDSSDSTEMGVPLKKLQLIR